MASIEELKKEYLKGVTIEGGMVQCYFKRNTEFPNAIFEDRASGIVYDLNDTAPGILKPIPVTLFIKIKRFAPNNIFHHKDAKLFTVGSSFEASQLHSAEQEVLALKKELDAKDKKIKELEQHIIDQSEIIATKRMEIDLLKKNQKEPAKEELPELKPIDDEPEEKTVVEKPEEVKEVEESAEKEDEIPEIQKTIIPDYIPPSLDITGYTEEDIKKFEYFFKQYPKGIGGTNRLRVDCKNNGMEIVGSFNKAKGLAFAAPKYLAGEWLFGEHEK